MRGSSKTAKYCYSALKSLVDDLSSSHYGENLDNSTNSRSSKKRTRSVSATRDSVQNPNRPSTADGASKRQGLGYGGEDSASNQSRHNVGNPTEGISERDRDYPVSSNLNYAATTLQSDQYDNSGENNVTPFWIQQSGPVPNAGVQPATYEQDIFGQLSCENLFQSDEVLPSGFWNMNNFLPS